MSFKVGAPARVGLVAPNSVEVPAGGTGLDPSQTNFFQVCSPPQGSLQRCTSRVELCSCAYILALLAPLLGPLSCNPGSCAVLP